MTTVGVISFQGDFEQHVRHLGLIGTNARRIRDPAQLEGIDGLILPGGESTTIGMLLERFGLLERIRRMIGEGLPVFGTCAGAILLADEIVDSIQPNVGGLHVSIRRNAYGRQIESFEARLHVERPVRSEWADSPPLGVFIRAPIIERVEAGVETLVTFENEPVLVRQAHILAATYHPELTGDTGTHAFFVEQIIGRRG